MGQRVFKIVSCITIALVVLGGKPAAAFYFCSEPTKPYCVDRYDKFDDEWEYRRCRSELESFKSQTEEFVECLKRAADEALNEYRRAVQSFNRRARGY